MSKGSTFSASRPVAKNGSVLKCRAPAKLNLYLHVLGRRPDGYHELDSLVVFAEVGDVVGVEPGQGLRLSITGPFAAGLATTELEDNLVMRAAKALAAWAGLDGEASVQLEKRLPVAAGIGGGSADAAATLIALNHHWRLDISSTDLAALGMKLGADVPACLNGQPLYMAGAGEQIDPAPWMPSLPVVLVSPNVALSTANVLAAFQGPWSKPGRMGPASGLDNCVQALAQRRNDLQPAAMALQPEIGHALDVLGSSPGCALARMSGSGPVCFGIFGSADGAKSAAQEISNQHPGWWVMATTAVGT